MRKRSEATSIAIFFAILSVASLAVVLWIPYRTPSASFPLRLTPGYTLERDFRATRTANYRVSIYCSTGGDLSHVPDVLKRGNLVQIAVSENGAQLKLYYFSEPPSPDDLTTNWGNIASGPAQDELGQDIADFAAERGKTYHISCSVIRPVAELDQKRPRLYFWLDPLDGKGDVVLSGFLLLGAIGSAGLSWNCCNYCSANQKQAHVSDFA